MSSSNLAHGEVYSIQHYVIHFCGFLLVGTLVSSTNTTDRNDITEILLKVALNTMTSPLLQHFIFVSSPNKSLCSEAKLSTLL